MSKILIIWIGVIMIFYYFCIMKKFIRYIAVVLAAVICVRCANVVTPNGGPKDEKPPVVTESSPANNSTNFQGKTIHITFDEFITLDNAANNILISPPLTKKPIFRTNGKTLIIRFEETLRPETTYSIYFGNAIKDLHEGNIFKNYAFVFSTGEKIDSLSLKGKVISASTLAPMEGFYVGLYSDNNDTIQLDSLPYYVKPNYITTTAKDGQFSFSGLADKDFLIFALKDNNFNQIFDQPSEEIAFYPELVRPYYIEKKIVNDTLANDSITETISETIADTIPSIIQENVSDSITEVVPGIAKPEYPVYELHSFTQEDSIQKIFKKELVENGLLRFVFRYPATNVSIQTMEELPDTFNIIPVYSTRQDTVLWYFTPNKDSLWVCISDGVSISDTTHYSLKPRSSLTKRKRKQTEMTIKPLTVKNNVHNSQLKPEQQLILSFDEPIVRIDMPDTLTFIENQDTIYNNLEFVKYDEYGLQYLINKTFTISNKYQIIIPDSVFYGIRGVTNPMVRLNFSVAEESQFGNIYLTIEVPENVPQLIIELTTDKGKLIDKQIITKTQEVAFEYLDPGIYKLKATLDLDANGIWSPGNFNKWLQPEKIVFFKGTLEVRANWDIDLDEPWKIEN